MSTRTVRAVPDPTRTLHGVEWVVDAARDHRVSIRPGYGRFLWAVTETSPGRLKGLAGKGGGVPWDVADAVARGRVAVLLNDPQETAA